MARTPNYSFERHERNRAKAIKLAKKADAKRQQREHCGNPRVRERLHRSRETMAAKPAEHFLSAVGKHRYRKSDPQDQPNDATVSLQ